MSRRRLATALLALIAAWPAVTLWLQARWDVDPWKLMSFGMYSAPGRWLEDVRVTVRVLRAGEWIQAPVDTSSFREARRTFGKLAQPNFHLGERTRIEIVEVRLDPESARVVHRREVLEQ